MRKLIKPLAIIFALGLIASLGVWYMLHNERYPSTDDAYVQAHVVYIAARVNGKVNRVLVKDNQYVQKGQLLFSVDPRSYQIALNKAIAELANTQQQIAAAKSAVAAAKALVTQRKAQLINTQKNTRRILKLVKEKLAPVADGDAAISQLQVAKAALTAAKSQLAEATQQLGSPGTQNAQLRIAQATVAQARIQLNHTQIFAPSDGYLVNFNLQIGSVLTAYQELFALVKNKHFWVSANYKETQLDRIRVGQPVKINIDMYPDHTFNGTVQSISAGSGASFALLPPENASGNWVKVTQRFPVRIRIDNPSKQFPLRIGASSTVTVDTVAK